MKSAAVSGRRGLYRRSNTLSSIPVEDLHLGGGHHHHQHHQRRTSDEKVAAGEHGRLLAPIEASPVHETSSGDGGAVDPRKVSFVVPSRPPQRTGSTVGRGSGDPATTAGGLESKRATFMRKGSCGDLLHQRTGAYARCSDGAVGTGGRIDETAIPVHNANSGGGSAGGLLSKVKDRIRDKMFQTSEWPQLAAVVQERRQRAADEYEARLQSTLAAPPAGPARKGSSGSGSGGSGSGHGTATASVASAAAGKASMTAGRDAGSSMGKTMNRGLPNWLNNQRVKFIVLFFFLFPDGWIRPVGHRRD